MIPTLVDKYTDTGARMIVRKAEGSDGAAQLFTTRSAILFTALLVIHAITLLVMGRIAWCKCGFGLWTSHAWSNETSQMLADPYSFTHVLHGIIFYFLLRYFMPSMPLHARLLAAMALEVGWEVLENTPFTINRYRAATVSLDYEGDSVLNSLGDILSALVGFCLAARLSWKWILALAVAIELVLLATIRDNLTLNILMLLYPIEAIKQWQTGS
jgi:Protein of unknown function (DUF2585)